MKNTVTTLLCLFLAVAAFSQKAIPGKIEAESYDAMSGIATENTQDSGGGLNVGWIDDNDWLDYKVSIPSNGMYAFNLRVAKGFGNGTVEVRKADGTVLGSVVLPLTGGWQSWGNAKLIIPLTAGTQTLRIYAKYGSWNFNWFEVAKYNTFPGKTEAENYDAMSGIATENTQDIGGGLNVGWIDDNDWLDYDVNVATTGTYSLRFRTAKGYGDGTIEIKTANGTVIGTAVLPITGGWQSWSTSTALVQLNAGPQRLRIYAKYGAWNFNWLEAVEGRPIGKIEAESYDVMSGIQLENANDIGGGQNVSWIDDNDWIDYNVKIPTSGSYKFKFRVTNPYGTAQIQLRNAAGNVLATITPPQTWDWQDWKTVETIVSLPAGSQKLRIYAVKGNWNFNWFDVSKPDTSSTPLPQSVINFAELPQKMVGDAPFNLNATGNNTQTPITFTSSNPSIVSVSNATGLWKATIHAIGSAVITASQEGNTNYLAAAPVSRTQAVTAYYAGTKIPIQANRWYQLNNVSKGLEGLFDGITDVAVHTGYSKVLENYDAYYPLLPGEQMKIDRIKFFDGEGSFADKPMTLSVITNDWQRIPLASFTGQRYNSWVGPYADRPNTFDLDLTITNARYLVINAWWGYPNEMELYGTYTPPTAPSNGPYRQKSIPLKDMLGVNAFEWDFQEAWDNSISETKLRAMKTFGGIRHYADWDKLEPNEGKYTFNPTHSGSWDYDGLYARLKAEGMNVVGCLKTIPPWLEATYPEGERDSENVPVRYGKNFSVPASYIEQAKLAFQYAARYGNNPNVNPALLSVDPSQRWNGDGINVVKIGLNLIKYMECDNERDKWWKGRKAYQTGREYAANLSAFYDGHKNTMGPGVGVKNADPSMKVVMAGLASPFIGIDYIRGMIDWCKEFRGYKPDGSVNLCWDVINYHFYPDNSSSTQDGTGTRGVAPEVSKAAEVAQNFIRIAQQYAQDMPVWMSETGYDVNQGSPLKAIAIGNRSILQTQADWTLRNALLYARKGVERVYFYQTYDYDINNPSQFGSSGLLNGDRTRKPAADFLYQTNRRFGKYIYKETLQNDPIIDRYELNGKSAYVLVIPDEKGRTGTATLNLGGATSAKIYKPTIGSDSMQVEAVNTVQGLLTLTVTETPVFVVASDQVTTATADSSSVAVARVGVQTNAMFAPNPLETEHAKLHDIITVYPNPSTDYVMISFESNNPEPLEVKIFNANLGILHREASFSKTTAAFSEKIDVSKLLPGAYIIEVSQGNERAFRKIVKAP
ncbi:carbohydrate-binding protein [Runella slithyformis]|uniref:Carbohydrate binding family 6 n=1 Tax=Runella slithyformis (strain ATCC 29530 / DSM 19594 / LMG 11500 / NCIMB 11436 / LSU 4) TaxID=761193 RepID=A0A7U4E6X8_RUNSL|nr:carbohydrate-binding protein [Runella slithyformis]AEI49779.1 Carbohydrate binding family 6 [Runella slithyformis DSM 19594]